MISNFVHYDFALSVYSTLWVVLTDVVFQNNSSPLMNTDTNSVDFTGNFIVSSNNHDGVRISKGHVIIHPGSHINISNNRFGKIGLNLLNCNSINIGNREDDIVMFFHNNTINESGIFSIINTRGRIINVMVSFINNTSIGFEDELGHAGIMLLQRSVIGMNDSSVRFVANSSPLSGGLTMISTELDVLNISGEFLGNHGNDGGGLSLYERSHFVFVGYSSLIFYHNTASRKGGAIFVEDSDYINSHTKISKNLRALLIFSHSIINLVLSGDRATLAGNEVYGGWIDILDQGAMYNISQDGSDLSTVASNPTRVCLCINSTPDCNILEYHLAVYPGEMFEIEAVAVGQRMGVVPSIIIADLGDKSLLYEGQDVQSVGKECTTLQYRIRSLRRSEAIILRAQDIGAPKLNEELERTLPSRYHILFKQMSISTSLRRCPIGFNHDKNLRECVCSQVIKIHSGINCNLNSYSITRTAGAWLNAKVNYNTTVAEYIIAIHDHCPYGYCRTDTNSLTINLESSDNQCAYDRSGVLCGACKVNYSQVFGTVRCKVCSQVMLPVIILASIIAGLVLVGILMVLNLTVSSGNINGIIFYANVIRISQTVFFPIESGNTFLTTFIAWLNLDLGIEVCFYDGLDAYAKTWLQFAFPFYVWLMVITIIVASHYSTTASKEFGNNGLQVLATLFLLSYAKILRVVVTVFSYTILSYSDDSVEKVWLYDGNVKFLEGKHVPLFIASLTILFILSFFYTIPLVTIQWLQRISHYRVLCWVHKLMPLFDAYTGPYKFKHRYWTGILLLVRVVFLLIFSLNESNNPAINLLAIAVIIFTLLVYVSYVRVYKNWVYSVLEISCLFNLALLSVVTFYQMATEGKITFTTSMSVGIALCTLILIVVYHSIKRLLSIRGIKYASEKIITKLRKKTTCNVNEELQNNLKENIKYEGLTHTSVELYEPLVVSCVDKNGGEK